jgi:FkbM family methyltransferase
MVYGRSVVTVALLGAEVVIHSELENGYLRASRRSRYMSLFRDEASVLINVASLIGDDCTFVDVGANIGIYSAVMSRLRAVRRGLSVIAFEVDPNTFRRLEQNARLHGFRAENVALGASEKMLTFVRGAVSHVTTTEAAKNNYNINNETFVAQCLPLSSFDIPGSSIVIKIDVEGGEYEVLLGASKFFAAGRVKAVYLDGAAKLEEVMEFLRGFGFKFLDGSTLRPAGSRVFALLAVKEKGITS